MALDLNPTTGDEILQYTVEGQLVSLEPADEQMINQFVSVTIDGRAITVPRVQIARDANAEPIRDAAGNAQYRYTTIYDAANEAYSKLHEQNPIHVLCHREHMEPAAVCRVCMVEVRSEGRSEGSLAPACHRLVDDKTDIFTAKTSDKVKSVVGMVTELLSSDQPDPREHLNPTRESDITQELSSIAREVGVGVPRFGRSSANRGQDRSSSMIDVDHSACILCDRCVRACQTVVKNDIISRTGRGYAAKISFDLNDPMGQSNCVSCGECAISCPTDALSFKEGSKHQLPDYAEDISFVELRKSFPLVRDLPPRLLQFNERAFWRRSLKKGDTVFEEGEHGSTAFLIESGRFEVKRRERGKTESKPESFFGLFNSFKTVVRDSQGENSGGVGEAVAGHDENGRTILDEKDLLFGEMTCLSNYPRSATVVALDDDCSVIEIRRNLLQALKRNLKTRRILDERFRRSAISSFLGQIDILRPLKNDGQKFNEITEYLRDRVQLIEVNPGQTIYQQGGPADSVDLVRIGFVKVSTTTANGEEFVRSYVGPNSCIGELACISGFPDAGEEIKQLLPEAVRGRRTATCTAVDHVELLRIPADKFAELYRSNSDFREQIDKVAIKRLQADDTVNFNPESMGLGEFLEQGLQNARSLLVLDLHKCTRCDECVRACADAHEGVTRLIRDGMRFDKFLVASSCRACLDPTCMVGCPVDAIHRGDSGEMKIENWCIGCGECADNCPYGNINMHEVKANATTALGWLRGGGSSRDAPIQGRDGKAELQVRATICDLCQSPGGRSADDTSENVDNTLIKKLKKREPACVYACPHDAAHRMRGSELLEEIRKDRGIAALEIQ
ncbi:cyclic nucleotide-binding domain-containing protein [Stratiformator vulcanicus]|uniref:NADP-reducing hydrogenase subunit HndC n=1 Tax=Stratiformator vulcanicus TaxID=2527980 RepID=A0A517QX00_9PLAN|nr:cyclic nucleotide-binding domain-containing protein [Stratiformator vulcanicus]QDT36189.1 NADP-reducing hydrogenase subunit HndC [Stratiformator vulcanicus]